SADEPPGLGLVGLDAQVRDRQLRPEAVGAARRIDRGVGREHRLGSGIRWDRRLGRGGEHDGLLRRRRRGGHRTPQLRGPEAWIGATVLVDAHYLVEPLPPTGQFWRGAIAWRGGT